MLGMNRQRTNLFSPLILSIGVTRSAMTMLDGVPQLADLLSLLLFFPLASAEAVEETMIDYPRTAHLVEFSEVYFLTLPVSAFDLLDVELPLRKEANLETCGSKSSAELRHVPRQVVRGQTL